MTLGRFVISLLATSSLLVSGCATMDKSQCEVANWEVIGLEDGARGKPGSYIGKHRSACAEYGIAPNLEQYLAGHKQGLKQYCTYQSGFDLANSGNNFSHICDSTNKSEFLSGYNKGKQYYIVRSEINDIEANINQSHNKLNKLEQQIKNNEAIIIAGKTSANERRLLLDEISLIRSEIEQIVIEVDHLTHALENKTEQYRRLSN